MDDGMTLEELNDLLRENLLLAIAATLDENVDHEDGWLELVFHWEAWVKTTHKEAIAKGYVY